jgi:hypothetical protein
MFRILLSLCGVLLLVPTAHAETCAEERESCLESCQIDYGMESDRVKLGKCVKRCEQKKEDCHDLKREERLNRDSPREPIPEERRAGSDVTGTEAASVDIESEPKAKPSPPPDSAEPEPKAKGADAEEKPKVKPRPKPKPKADEDDPPPRRKQDDDDWAK